MLLPPYPALSSPCSPSPLSQHTLSLIPLYMFLPPWPPPSTFEFQILAHFKLIPLSLSLSPTSFLHFSSMPLQDITNRPSKFWLHVDIEREYATLRSTPSALTNANALHQLQMQGKLLICGQMALSIQWIPTLVLHLIFIILHHYSNLSGTVLMACLVIACVCILSSWMRLKKGFKQHHYFNSSNAGTQRR